MPARVFTDLLARGVREGHVPERTKTARDWFRKEARKIRNVKADQIIRESSDRWRNQAFIGHCYLYNYDPKWKKELPYYDSFPIVFPFSKQRGRFTGLNLHYLPYAQRAVLMDALHELRNNNRFDESTKLNMTWEALKAMAKSKYARPCVHTYLQHHLRSRLVKIDPADWSTAIFLPVHEFRKASADKVWRDSREKIGLKRSRRPSKS